MLATAQIGVTMAKSHAARSSIVKSNNSDVSRTSSSRHRVPSTRPKSNSNAGMTAAQRKAIALMDGSRHSTGGNSSTASPPSSSSASKPRSSLNGSLHNNKTKRPAPRLSAQAPKTLDSGAFDAVPNKELRLSERSTNSSDGIPLSITLDGGTATTATTSVSEQKNLETQAENILQDMVQAISVLSKQEDELTKSRAVHQERARGRLDSGNSMGAMLSIKKWKRVQTELAALTQALDELEHHHEALQGALIAEKLQGTTLLDDSSHHQPGEAAESLAAGLPKYQTIVQEVQSQLAENKDALDNKEQGDSSKDNDEELLQEFRDFCASRK